MRACRCPIAPIHSKGMPTIPRACRRRTTSSSSSGSGNTMKHPTHATVYGSQLAHPVLLFPLGVICPFSSTRMLAVVYGEEAHHPNATAHHTLVLQHRELQSSTKLSAVPWKAFPKAGVWHNAFQLPTRLKKNASAVRQQNILDSAAAPHSSSKQPYRTLLATYRMAALLLPWTALCTTPAAKQKLRHHRPTADTSGQKQEQ